MGNFNHLSYEIVNQEIARILINRPELANAQNTEMLYELNRALDLAAQQDCVKVIILGALGKHFSAGHDLSEKNVQSTMAQHNTVAPLCCFSAQGIEGHMAREEEIYYGFCERWRNIPKPTIAAVQGKCIAGGLMLIWPCDLILASEDATFCDPTLRFGVPGVEYFTLPLEIGSRKAKEMLFTAGELTANEARELGMVNRVVGRDVLHAEALSLAENIAKNSSFALKLAKQTINQWEDAQGRVEGLSQAFTRHQLAHAHNLSQFDSLLDPRRLPTKTREALGKQT